MGGIVFYYAFTNHTEAMIDYDDVPAHSTEFELRFISWAIDNMPRSRRNTRTIPMYTKLQEVFCGWKSQYYTH